MNTSEIQELKKRLKIRKVSFTRIAGCYVNDKKEKLCTFGKQFLNLPEDEIFKYLEIAGRLLSGRLGDNMMELAFPLSAEAAGGGQALLMALRESELKDEALLDQFYDRIIGSFEKSGNYLILLYADRYDVPVKTKDNIRNDESDEVYTYILCAVCPVELSRPGLSYVTEDNTISARNRDWVVNMPETGFLFPAFNDRSTDIHACLFYSKDPAEPHGELAEQALGAALNRTGAQCRAAFRAAVTAGLGEEKEKAEETYADIQYALHTAVETFAETAGEETPLLLDRAGWQEVLTDAGVKPERIDPILEEMDSELDAAALPADGLVESAAVKKGAQRADKKVLVELLAEKTQQLKDLSGAAEALEKGTFFRSVLEQDPAPVVLCDLNHTVIYMNPAAIRRYAYAGGGALVGGSLMDCHTPEAAAAICRVVDWFRRDKDHNRIYTFRNDEEDKDVYMIALRDETGRLIGYYEKHEYRSRETMPLYLMED